MGAGFERGVWADPLELIEVVGRVPTLTRRREPSCKQHTAVDDARGAVLDVAVTTGDVDEGEMIEAQLDGVRRNSAREIETVTADVGYADAKAYSGLERRGIDPMSPAKKERMSSRARAPLPIRCQARHSQVPAVKILRRNR